MKREDILIQTRLRLHKSKMDAYIDQGMSREDASKKAYDEVRKYRISVNGIGTHIHIT